MSEHLEINDSITILNGVGPKIDEQLNNQGINKVQDLLNYLPRSYLDYSTIEPINRIKPGNVNLKIQFKSIKHSYSRRGLSITKAIASDSTGSVLITWFNQPYRANTLSEDSSYFIAGKYELSAGRFSIINPLVEDITKDNISTARIVPIYRETKNLSSNLFRKLIYQTINSNLKVEDYLDITIRKRFNLIDLNEAIRNIHFPVNSNLLAMARHRISFNDLFQAILASELNKREIKKDSSIPIRFNQKLAQKFIGNLPFKLTDNQRIVIWQILKDISTGVPMNRLLEGEVGSGKTVVAAMVSLIVMADGYQVAIMAPTEILARQHYQTIVKMFESFDQSRQVALLLGNTPAKEKTTINKGLLNNTIKLVIGTHALISDKIKFNNLAFVVVDEQHRFGVQQRRQLKSKASKMPHLLTLSATPIPRSLALTIFRELAISVLKDKPFSTKPVETFLLSESMYLRRVSDLKKVLERQEQIVIVCPNIDSTINSHNSLKNVLKKASEQFKEYKVEAIHGRMSTNEKTTIMERFLANKIDILVSTTVIEVGIDIPNLTAIVILSSERFGLAQLYQLRGRVGRHLKAGLCFLVHADSTLDNQRLKAILGAKDAFELAEYDLAIRGPGAIYGQLQHGNFDLDLNLINNKEMLNDVRSAVDMFLQNKNNLLKSKQLSINVENLRKIINLD